MLKVLVADDIQIVRFAIKNILDASRYVVAEAKSAAEAIDKIIKHQPDLVILDYGLGDNTGMEVYRRTHKLSPKTRYILHTDNSDVYLYYRVMHETFIEGVVRKQNAVELTRAVECVAQGGTYYDQGMCSKVIEYIRLTKGLSENQRKILYLSYLCGRSNEYVAERIQMTSRNVSVNRRKIAKILTNQSLSHIKQKFSTYSGKYTPISSV